MKLILALLLAAGIATAQEKHRFAKDFSAELWLGNPGDADGKQLGKMFAHETKLRIELGNGTVGITDLSTRKTMLMKPSEKIAKSMEEAALPGFDSSFIDIDPKTGPCGKTPNRTCKKLGDEKLDGRAASKWQMTMPNAKGGTEKAIVWVDDVLKLPLKNLNETGRWLKLTHVEEVAQPAELFVVPADYRLLSKPPG